jgi:hypothetical protein
MAAALVEVVTRLVAVLGYSPRRGADLHPVCAARLACAEALAEDDDVVLLSGWSRRNSREPEAELMARAWRGREVRLLRDPDARHTIGNALAVARTARDLDATEVVVVTSWWHRRRAELLVRRAIGASGPAVTSRGADSPRAPLLLAREGACMAVLPVQLRLARRSAG